MATGRSPLIGMFAAIGFLVLGFVGVGYTMGWIEFHNSDNEATIEFDKVEASADTEYAAERTEKFVKETGESLKEASESLTSESDESIEVEAEVDPTPRNDGDAQ